MSIWVDQWFAKLLQELNAEVAACEELVEGNLFYKHIDPDFPNAPIAKEFESKRQNLLTACRNRSMLLEIGVNAGHSALWMLHHNPQLTYYGVDNYDHEYTAAAAAFLTETYPNRVHFFAGDSVHVLPKLREQNKEPCFDVIHVDGCHEPDHCRTDTYNALSMATPDCWIIIDDSNIPHIQEFHAELLENRLLKDAQPDGWKADATHFVGIPA